tara:strand:+ start:1013 stop:1120 length:108 start_codon:yes stop_codon:yes gene_type:complete
MAIFLSYFIIIIIIVNLKFLVGAVPLTPLYLPYLL